MNQDDNTNSPVAPVQATSVADAGIASDNAGTAAMSASDTTNNVATVPSVENADVAMPPASDAGMVAPEVAKNDTPASATGPDAISEVIKKISGAQNVLVALSADPSVDEMAAAIGLSLFLDKLGKRATAIYSGATPNALEFLKPEDTFESTADSLQDFVIALNKDKADHLRYKLDGSYVKIYITPYKTRVSEKDLEFSYGDYNVDLVLALDVVNGADLDAALREHGRIMHDASIINITTGNPGKFGEIEWSDRAASSVSEMIAKMLYNAGGETQISKDEATAFLTGIVAATNRFSNAKTTPDTMQVASRLMGSGANQQLVSKNITPEVENEMFSVGSVTKQVRKDSDAANLDIKHDVAVEADKSIEEKGEVANIGKDEPVIGKFDKVEVEGGTTIGSMGGVDGGQDSTLLNDLKAAEESLAKAGDEVVQDMSNQPVKIDGEVGDAATLENELNTNNVDLGQQAAINGETNVASEDSAKYGRMLENAIGGNDNLQTGVSQMVGSNPAAAMAPQVTNAPEINGVPEMNYMPLPNQEILPPPPTPPIDMNGGMVDGAMPSAPVDVNASATSVASFGGETASYPNTVEPPVIPVGQTNQPVDATGQVGQPMGAVGQAPQLGNQPAMQDQVYVPQAVDPGAFKIPGM